MPLEHTPLDPAALGEEANRALAGPMQKLAARGLAPVSEPTELASVLYQLATGRDAELAREAESSATGLPDGVLRGALGSELVDPRVLDFFAHRVVHEREPLLEVIVQNPRAAPQTVADIAARGSARLVDLIADNQRRLLEHPSIIASMYTNPQARMSTVDRVVEIAVRQGVVVRGIPAWDELAAAVHKTAGGDPLAGAGAETDAEAKNEADALFASAALRASADPDASGDGNGDSGGSRSRAGDAPQLPMSQLTVPQKIRLATLGKASARATLIRDPARPVAMAAIKAPSVNEAEVQKYAANSSLHEDVVKYIAARREWTKLYGVKLALVQNPKTPLASSMRLLPHLRERDIRVVSRSKGVPSALAAQARKLLTQKARG